MYSSIDRYINPFEVRNGMDEEPDFEPSAGYLFVLSMCIDACNKLTIRNSDFYTLKEIKAFLKEYEDLFEITETWRIAFSGFDKFSFTYLEFCEMKVLIEDYGKDCQKALGEIEKLSLKDWIEKYEIIYNHLITLIDLNYLENLNFDAYFPLIDSKYIISKNDLLNHFEFIQLFKKLQ